MALEDFFSVQIFFIILRETVESAIIVLVLLLFLKQNFANADGTLKIAEPTYRGLQRQIWVGAVAGLVVCTLIGGMFIVVFYFVGSDLWLVTERLWEGVFLVLSSLIISAMGVLLLRLSQMQAKWQYKLGAHRHQHAGHGPEHHQRAGGVVGWFRYARHAVRRVSAKYFLAILPLVTTLREGLEAVVFVGGIGVLQPALLFPLAILCGAALGASVGITLYRGGNRMSLQYFLIASTAFLYIVAAGLMLRGVWFFELEQYVRRCDGQDMLEVGSGPGLYDILNSVWHVNCCNGLTDGGWMLLNALVGWTNSATYGSVGSYLAFWTFIVVALRLRLYEERHGVYPWIPVRWQMKRIRKRLAITRLKMDQGAGEYAEVGSVQSDEATPEAYAETAGLLASLQ